MPCLPFFHVNHLLSSSHLKTDQSIPFQHAQDQRDSLYINQITMLNKKIQVIKVAPDFKFRSTLIKTPLKSYQELVDAFNTKSTYNLSLQFFQYIQQVFHYQPQQILRIFNIIFQTAKLLPQPPVSKMGKVALMQFGTSQIKAMVAGIMIGAYTLNMGNILIDRGYSSHYFKIRSLLQYFSKQIKEQRKITFQRVILENPQALLERLHISDRVFQGFQLTESRMEDFPDAVFIDFANKHIGGGSLYGSAAQEQNYFAQCPQLYSLMPIFQQMLANQAITAKGFIRIAINKGYRKTTEYDKIDQTNQIRQMIAVDAINFGFGQKFNKNLQSKKKNVQRELVKLAAGLHKFQGRKVITGNWGCGAFCGYLLLKFVIQAVIFSEYSVKGIYSLTSQKQQVKELNEKLRGSQVRELMQILREIWAKEMKLQQIGCFLNQYKKKASL